MYKLDELTELDNSRYETMKMIKDEIYNYINMKKINGTTVNVKMNTIVLKSRTELENDFIKDFCRDYELCLAMKETVTVENYYNDVYPLGFSSVVKYLFKSSGGIF